jgi:hypothetical protein
MGGRVTNSQAYTWDDTTFPDVIVVNCGHADALIVFLATELATDYPYVTGATDSTCTVMTDGAPLHNSLLGNISEFVAYVLAKHELPCNHPFIHCFKAASPTHIATFPMVDVGGFLPGESPDADILWMQEIKTTRTNEQYFAEVLPDYEGLFSSSRLAAKAEEIKFQLRHAGQTEMLGRINACLGTCPADSANVRLYPTGVSSDSRPTATFVSKLRSLVASLKKLGWPNVIGMYIRVTDIDLTYRRFARGEGLQ